MQSRQQKEGVWRRRAALLVAIFLAALAVMLAATDLPGDSALYPPRPGSPTVTAFVASNGFHAGIVIARADLKRIGGERGSTALAAVAERFAFSDFLEFGWGEEHFYRGTPGLAAFQWRLAARALFWPNETVVHVAGFSQPPQVVFAGAQLARIALSEAGFARLAARLDATFARDATGALTEIGPGLYGPSLFYRATGQTGPFNVCNNWIGRLLNAAGLADQPLLSTAANGILADLHFRSGVTIVGP